MPRDEKDASMVEGVPVGTQDQFEKNDDKEITSEGEAPKPRKRGRAATIAVGCAAALCLGGLAWALCTQPLAPAAAGSGSGSARGSAPSEAPAAVTATFDISLDGWGEGASPLLAHVTGETTVGAAVDFWHAFWPGDGLELALEPGEYSVSWVSPVGPDGSIWRVSGSSSVAPDGAVSGDAGFEYVAAENVTQADLDAIVSAVGEAVAAGDESLSGDAGQAVVDAVSQNAQAAPQADASAIEEEAAGAAGQVADEPSGSSGGRPAGGSASGSQQGGSSGGQQQGGSSNAGSGGGQQSQPQHEHSWVAVTEQRWVQDSAAWDEQVITGSYIQCSCGATFGSNAEWSSHNQSLGPGNGHSYSVQNTYGTVHHEATGHYETVTTGYRCSGCGATR